ncbi:NACHT domain-containing protein [Agrobacterium genomosp. 3 str. RTP8]|uniref:NACHT domain-containing protein n=1 Tax=Agrobacterium tomkonis TaxID=1183410 RepID=UPI001CDA1B13|nr:NACHT domain-containing protein [Agrobacterium tomkonis RTP8]
MDGLPSGTVSTAAQFAKDALVFLTDKGRREAAKLSVDIEYGFRKFLERNFRQYSKIKTLLNSGAPVSLEATFESPHLKIDGKRYNEDGFLNLLGSQNFFVITGMGGSGKSVFLKHLFIRYYNEGRGRIPFLVELRNVPREVKLQTYIHDLLKSVCPSFDDDLLDYALRSGKFIFLFDGFDEVEFNSRKKISEEIIGITYKYGDNIVLVSSRPDDIFQSWSEFYVAEMRGFTKTQVISLIKKLKYDRGVKANFLGLIRSGHLYETHSAYLSNPLLCNIMLLTFDQGAEVPKKMHLFFGQTFDVLFYRHDATKGTAFRRKFRTSLSIDDFRAVLASFSAFSYIDFGPSLNRDAATSSAAKSLKYCRFNERPEDFLADLCSSVSLLIKEGDNYSYVHRSFQEYFFALFLSYCDIERWGDVIEQLVKQRPNDSVVPLLSDINKEKFEQDFLAPRISELAADIRKIDVEKNPAKAFLLFFLDVFMDVNETDNDRLAWTIGRDEEYPKWYYMTRFLRDNEASEKLLGFDWRGHITRYGKARPDSPSDELSLGFVTDEALRNTPMVAYLQALKDTALRLDLSLKNNAQTRHNLLADALFNKPGGLLGLAKNRDEN